MTPRVSNLVWLDSYVPRVKREPWGLVCLVLNVAPIPGLGTVIAAAHASHKWGLVIGVAQLATAPFMVGIFWAWIWGVLIWLKSRRRRVPSRLDGPRRTDGTNRPETSS